MKKINRYLLLILLLPLWLAACGGTESTAPAGMPGPGLIMFYTDN